MCQRWCLDVSEHSLCFLWYLYCFAGVTAQKNWRPFCQGWNRSSKIVQSLRTSTSSPLTLPKTPDRRVWVREPRDCNKASWWVSELHSVGIKCSTLCLFPDLEMAVAYWNLVLSGRFKFLDLWNRFLLVSQRREVRGAPIKCAKFASLPVLYGFSELSWQASSSDVTNKLEQVY